MRPRVAEEPEQEPAVPRVPAEEPAEEPAVGGARRRGPRPKSPQVASLFRAGTLAEEPAVGGACRRDPGRGSPRKDPPQPKSLPQPRSGRPKASAPTRMTASEAPGLVVARPLRPGV